MTRKLLGVLLVAAMLLSCGAALAEKTFYGDMVVINCEEWVSLRDVPGTGGKRLAKVPLYAVVTDAEWEPICGDFIYCCYEGQYGYILSQYLMMAPDDGADIVMNEQMANLRIVAERSCIDGGEYLYIDCEDETGALRWQYETHTDDVTELTLTTAFLGGPAQDPMVLVYNAMDNLLTALEPFDGGVIWQKDIDLGASNTWATSGEGIAYIGGYYGPDPVAVDYNGNVLWRADSGDCAWLYEMELDGDRLICTYDLMDNGGSGRIIYDLDGNLLEKHYD